MPVYEYACSCGHRFEKLAQRMSAKDNAECPKCKKKAPRALSMMSVGTREKSAPEMPMCGKCGVPGPCGMN